MKKNPEFFPVKAISKKETKKYSNDITLPSKYPSQFIKLKEILKKTSKK